MAKTRAQKRKEAELRQTEYDKLSTDTKLARIKSQPGKSRKQLKRLKM